MAKKKIVKLTDEQYLKYIMSLKGQSGFMDSDGHVNPPDVTQISEDNKSDN